MSEHMDAVGVWIMCLICVAGVILNVFAEWPGEGTDE